MNMNMNMKTINFVTFCNPLSAKRTNQQSISVTSLKPRRQNVIRASAHTLDGQTIEGPLKPASHNLLIKVGEADDTTSGGIIIPDDAQEKPTFGEVIEAGPGKFLGNGILIPMNVDKGDTVMYGKYGGTELKYDGIKHTVVTQDDVLCKFKNGEYAVDSCEPICDRLLIKVNNASEETASGLFISGASKETQKSGTVISMGPGRFMENGEIEPKTIDIGDQVYYSSYAGSEITLENEEYVVIRVADVFAKV